MVTDPATAVIAKTVYDQMVEANRINRLRLADSFGRALGRLDVVRSMVVAGRPHEEIRRYIDDSLTYLDAPVQP